MRIHRNRIVDPRANGLYGGFAVAISFFVFAYSTRFGQLPILVYYGLWFPLLLIAPQKFLRWSGGLTWIAAFAALALFSTFWSAAPSTSARASVQFLTHIVCAVVAARCVSIRTLTFGGLAGVTVVLLYSLAVGGYHYDPIDGAFSFVGAFSSKNQLGFFASLGIFLGFSAVVLLRERGIAMVISVLVGLLSGACLYLSQSATSMISIIFALGVGLGVRMLQSFSPTPRTVLAVAGGLLVIVAAVGALQMGAFDAILGAFGKDATLTGRTYLWSQGIAAAGENPVLGRGYYAYWVHGYSEAERLWTEFYITARTGFHFHNTYIETAVELGLAGVILLVVLLYGTTARHLVRLLRDPDARASQVLFGLGAMLMLRSFVEVDVIMPYVVGSFLLFYAVEYREPVRSRADPARPVPVAAPRFADMASR